MRTLEHSRDHQPITDADDDGRLLENGALVIQHLPALIEAALPHRQAPSQPIAPAQRVREQAGRGSGSDLPQVKVRNVVSDRIGGSRS
jgi:hypothetical protein